MYNHHKIQYYNFPTIRLFYIFYYLIIHFSSIPFLFFWEALKNILLFAGTAALKRLKTVDLDD